MKVIRSSEISSYTYCPASWWISQEKGIKITPVMEQGLKEHEKIVENQPKARNYYIALLFFCAVLLFLLLNRFLT